MPLVRYIYIAAKPQFHSYFDRCGGGEKKIHTTNTSAMRAWLASAESGIAPAKPEDVMWDSSRTRAANTTREFFGSMILTTVTASAVLASGQLSIKFDLVELTAWRVLCIALANAFVSRLSNLV